jgi:Uma2 family endonuclease
MSALPKRYFTPQEYLLLENQAEYKSQYIAGEIYAMAGAEPEHIEIVQNITLALDAIFGGRPCKVYSSELRVRAEVGEMYTYPDVVALCGEPLFDRSSRPPALLNPQVIFEVLSPSTETFDRGEKFVRYRDLESLTDYILVAVDQMRVEHSTRQADGIWTITELQQPADRVALRSLACELTLAQIYRRMAFPKRPSRGS